MARGGGHPPERARQRRYYLGLEQGGAIFGQLGLPGQVLGALGFAHGFALLGLASAAKMQVLFLASY